MREHFRNQKGRMFTSDFFEFFSKVHPAAPFVFWIPIGAGVLGYTVVTKVSNWKQLATFVPLGFLGWQATEYFVHKKLFHWEGIGPISKRFHDIAHGFHHKYPDDDDRLVMPLPISITIAAALAGGLYLMKKPSKTVPVWLGALAGYLFYDGMHWATHFHKPKTAWGKAMRAHHLAHHFADPDSNFGISNRWMDKLMGTMRRRNREERKADDNGSFTPAVKAQAGA